MKQQKIYSVSDLFFTSWKQLQPKTHALVFGLQQQALALKAEMEEGETNKHYGYIIINLLRQIRKNWKLVDQINVSQAVDIYNDLKFLNEPWFFFPAIKITPKKAKVKFFTPEPQMARHTFDHFIYADNEFSAFIASQDIRYLKRLVLTIYQMGVFDKEAVEEVEGKVRLHEWQLMLVFFTYAKVREALMNRCKTLLPPAKKEADDVIQKPQRTGAMWLKLKHRLAETPAFQGYENAGRANMYAALDYLEDLAKLKENANA